MNAIYLDANATTRVRPEVLAVMQEAFQEGFANPGSRHGPGLQAAETLRRARSMVANGIGAAESEVVLTGGGTESINTALIGFARRHVSQGNPPGTFVLQQGEHPAGAQCARHLQSQGWRVRRIEVDRQGRIDLAALEQMHWKAGDILTILLAHNETGVVQDGVAIADLARRLRESGVWTHIDAVQAVGKVEVHFHRLGVDTMSIAAHKFYGPRGIGALLVRDRSCLEPLMYGGGQEQGLRPGTECVPLAIGMGKALECLVGGSAGGQQRRSQVAALRDHLEKRLMHACGDLGVPLQIHGQGAVRLPNTSFLSFAGYSSHELVGRLASRDVCCSAGSACKSNASGGSEILAAMNVDPVFGVSGGVRFSIPMFDCDEAQIDLAVEQVRFVLGVEGNGLTLPA